MSLWLRNLLWILSVVAVALLMWSERPGSRITNSPMIQQMSEMRRLCIKMLAYQETVRPKETEGWHIEDYVAHGALSQEDEKYLHEHHIIFHGFPVAQDVTIGGDARINVVGPSALLEATYSRSKPPRRIVFYSDGSGRLLNLEDSK